MDNHETSENIPWKIMDTQKISHGISWTLKMYLMEYHGILKKYLMEYHGPSNNISWTIMDTQKYLMEYHGTSNNISLNIMDCQIISHGISWTV